MNRIVQRRRANNNNNRRRTINPPPLQSNVILNHRYRFKSDTAIGGLTITDRDLLRAAGMVCTVANTTLTSIYQSVKLHSIEMWSTGGVGEVSSITLLWLSSAPVGNTTLEVSDSSISNAFPAHIFCRPPEGTAASWWNTGTDEYSLFKITTTHDVIIDVNVSLVLNDGTASDATLTVSTASLGAVYYAALDGASDQIVPIGLTTTT